MVTPNKDALEKDLKYILIEVDYSLDHDDPVTLEDVACGLKDSLDDLGVTAQVICPIPENLLKAIYEN
jgi:hypothetical protein